MRRGVEAVEDADEDGWGLGCVQPAHSSPVSSIPHRSRVVRDHAAQGFGRGLK